MESGSALNGIDAEALSIQQQYLDSSNPNQTDYNRVAAVAARNATAIIMLDDVEQLERLFVISERI